MLLENPHHILKPLSSGNENDIRTQLAAPADVMIDDLVDEST